MWSKWNAISEWMTIKSHHTMALFILERLLFLWFFLAGLHYIPLIDVLWGRESFLSGVDLPDGLVNNFFLKLKYARGATYSVFFFHLAFSLLGFFNILGRISKLGVFITGWMLFYAAQMAFHAGFYMGLNLMFFLLFYQSNVRTKLGHYFNNFAWLGMAGQVMVVYFLSALYKWLGTTWLDGTSIYNLTYWHLFFEENVIEFFQSHSWITIVINYVALAYLTVFPVIVWIKKIKVPFLFFGVLFHLSIGILMQIPYFSAIMIMSYLLLLDERYFSLHKILDAFRFKGDRE